MQGGTESNPEAANSDAIDNSQSAANHQDEFSEKASITMLHSGRKLIQEVASTSGALNIEFEADNLAQ